MITEKIYGKNTGSRKKTETVTIEWFERDKIIGQDTDSSLTNEMMMAFAAGTMLLRRPYFESSKSLKEDLKKRDSTCLVI